MLTVAFAFHNGDRDLALPAMQLIRDLGAGENHHCLIVCPGDTIRGEVEVVAREAFHAVDVHTYPARLSGWPQGPNEAFHQATERIAKDEGCGDFLWYETDCAITGKNAITITENVFRTCGQPILGNVVDTVNMGTKHIAGKHVVGVAVYPKGAFHGIKTIKSLTDMSYGYVRQSAIPMAFDAYIGPYTFQRCAEARIFQHFWRSGEFAITGGVIKAGKHLVGVENIVRPEAVLIHGCKDLSLLNIIREQQGLDEVRLLKAMNPRPALPPERPVVAQSTAPAVATPVAPKPPKPDPKKKTARMTNFPGPNDATRQPDPIRGKDIEAEPTERWYRNEGGYPIPPFLPGQAEFRRWIKLLDGRYETNGFKRLRDYARNNLGVNCKGLTAEKIIDQCVLAERAQGKEEWTKKLPGPWFPPSESTVVLDVAKAEPVVVAPPASPAPWTTTAPQEQTGSIMSPEMKRKMLALQEERARRAAGVTEEVAH